MIEEAIGFFNIFAGLMVVAAFLTFLGGFIYYLLCLGTEARVGGIKIMEWGVTILFVLIVLLGVVQFLEGHPGVAGGIAAIVVVAAVAWVVFLAAQDALKGKKSEKEE